MNFRTLRSGKTFHLLFVSASILTSLASFAQSGVAVAPIKMNVFYIGVDNPVSVAASNGGDERLTVSLSGGGEGSVSKISTGLYNVRVTNPTDECLMKVYVDDKLIGTSNFRVRNLPVPMGTIGGFSSGGSVPADNFRKQAGLGVFVKDFPFEVKYEVLGFTVTVEDEKGGVKSADCEGGLFSSQAMQYIEQYVISGKMVTIDKIRVKDPSGRNMKISSLVYYIK